MAAKAQAAHWEVSPSAQKAVGVSLQQVHQQQQVAAAGLREAPAAASAVEMGWAQRRAQGTLGLLMAWGWCRPRHLPHHRASQVGDALMGLLHLC